MYMHLVYLVTSIGCSLHIVHDFISPLGMAIQLSCSFVTRKTFLNHLYLIFQDKHEENHQPKLHGGLVIKHNANQRYATNAVTAFIFREIAEKHQLPIQVS